MLGVALLARGLFALRGDLHDHEDHFFFLNSVSLPFLSTSTIVSSDRDLIVSLSSSSFPSGVFSLTVILLSSTLYVPFILSSLPLKSIVIVNVLSLENSTIAPFGAP